MSGPRARRWRRRSEAVRRSQRSICTERRRADRPSRRRYRATRDAATRARSRSAGRPLHARLRRDPVPRPSAPASRDTSPATRSGAEAAPRRAHVMRPAPSATGIRRRPAPPDESTVRPRRRRHRSGMPRVLPAPGGLPRATRNETAACRRARPPTARLESAAARRPGTRAAERRPTPRAAGSAAQRRSGPPQPAFLLCPERPWGQSLCLNRRWVFLRTPAPVHERSERQCADRAARRPAPGTHPAGRWQTQPRLGHAASAANSTLARPTARWPVGRQAPPRAYARQGEAGHAGRRRARRCLRSLRRPTARASAPAPVGPAAASRRVRVPPARPTRRAARATTCDGHPAAARPTRARRHARARSLATGPGARSNATRCAIHSRRRHPHSRCAGLAHGDRQGPSTRALRAVVPEGASRIQESSRLEHPSPGPTGAWESVPSIAAAARAASGHTRHRGQAGRPGVLPGCALGASDVASGRSAYASNHSVALAKPKSTHVASAGCQSRQSRAAISGHAAAAAGSSTRRSIHTRVPVARSSDVPSSSATNREASSEGVCWGIASRRGCKKRDDASGSRMARRRTARVER